jgi:PAS domain S-box-containing protein
MYDPNINSPLIKIENDTDYQAALDAITTYEARQFSNEIIETKLNRSNLIYEKFLAIEKSISFSETTPDGTIIAVNEIFLKIFGYSKQELIGSNHRIFQSGIHPKSFYNYMWETLLEGKKWSGEVCERSKDGEIFWVYSIIVPILDFETQEIKSFLCLMHDITEKKRTEQIREESQYKLLQLQKIDSIGKMTSGIAHDFNNILMVILGFTKVGLMFSRQNEPQKAIPCLEKVQNAANLAADLINKMLTFCSEKVSKAKKPIDPSEIAEEVIKISQMLRTGISDEVAINLVNSLDDKSASILIDPTELHQMLTNLMVNAYDAIESSNCKNGAITLSLFSDTIQQPVLCKSCGKKVEGEFITIGVSDTGIGISTEKINDIFNPFFTTKEKGKGTGLGLAVVSGIIHNEDGHIIVESLPDEGTTFYLLFPPFRENTIDEEIPDLNHQVDKISTESHFKICVVDDNEDICYLFNKALTHFGHTVKTFSDSLAAKQFFTENPDYFDVIVTDYAMPNLTGLDLANFMLSIRPELPILICTGYSNKLKSSEDLPNGNTFLFKKPVDIKTINETIKTFQLRNNQ